MKKLYKYIVLVIGILAFSACTDDVEFPNVEVEEGTDVTLSLSLKPEISKEIINSRATADENKLYDLHIYVFEPAREVNGVQTGGKLIGYEQLDFGDGVIHENEPNTYSINVRTKTGTSYIYALANINIGSIYKLSPADSTLLNVTTYATNNKTTEVEVNALREAVEASTLDLATFKNINFNRTLPTGNEVISPSPIDKKFMMSGYLNDGNAVTIQKSGDNVSIQGGVNVIKLYRILAKNTFTINSPIDNTTQKPRFTLKSYRLHNVPVGGQLIPNAMISTANTAADYTTENITTAAVESHYQNYEGKSSFEFYYPENLRASTKTINAWEDREKNSYASGSKSFTNAPANAAYIEIQGDYVDNTGKLSANVSYTIHLGNFSKSLRDFNVIRNNHYVYTVQVNGVNDIIAEAKIKDDQNNDVDNPYAEGFVIKVGSGQHYDVDAHYEARVLKFTKSSIQALKNSHSTNKPGYILNISTPFGETIQTVNVKNDGVYTMSNVPICTIAEATDIDNANYQSKRTAIFGGKEADFRWMRFVRNTTSNVTKTGNDISLYTCKYPGDQNRYSSTNKGGWMNVFELLAELYYTDDDSETDNNTTDDDVYGNSGEVYYTCFIDENYYSNKAWSEYVNKDPRTMQIANKLFISEDKKSVYAEVAYSISQHSIATFYKDNSLVAFGTEIIDEEDKYSKAPYNYEDVRMGELGSIVRYAIFPPQTVVNENWDGYTSAVNTNKSENINKGWYIHSETKNVPTGLSGNSYWSTVIYSDVTLDLINLYPNIQPLYGAVGKACMSRNRDNDGDGKIDEGEVRWYLASVQQYHALYIAKNSLPAESALISEQELQTLSGVDYYNGWPQSGHDIRGKYHYYTSSPMGGAGTYWPEEGMTNNGVDLSSTFMQRAELVRCVRTLESGQSGENGAKYGLGVPDKYYKFGKDDKQDDYYIFDLSGIETRRADMTVLANHHELQELNELSSRFEVAKKSLYNSASYSLLNLTGQEKDPCQDEYWQETDNQGKHPDLGTWRTPNQKEVALMLAEIPSEMTAQRHGTRTRFSAYNGDNGTESWHGPYSWHTRYAFSVEPSNGKFNVTGDNESVNIRCVRDK